MDEEAFRAQFRKSPQDVVAFFQQKGLRGPDKHWDWSDTLRHAHDRAFVVAKATSLDLLTDIKGSLKTALEQGQSLGSWKKGLIPKLQEQGWWGKQEVVNPKTGEKQEAQLGSPRRLKTIYETNMRTAYDAGKYARMMEVVDSMPYWTYILGHVKYAHRPEHQVLEGLTFRYDDPFWRTHYPRQGYGCHCGVRNEDAADVERRTGKPLDQALLKSSPEDYQTKVVEVQGKQIEVVGYRPPGSSLWVYPQPGWDYAPGDFSWRTKQLLADRLVDLPQGTVRTAFLGYLNQAVRDDFRQYVDVIQNTGITRNEVLAVRMLDGESVQALAAQSFQISKTAKPQQLTLSTPLLLVTDRQLLHAIRDAKKAAGIAMPRELLQQLPELLQGYELRWDLKGALLAFSEPFRAPGKIQKQRWKVVFTPWNAGQGRLQLRFTTASMVGHDAISNGTARLLP